jgi:hypothetical protein
MIELLSYIIYIYPINLLFVLLRKCKFKRISKLGLIYGHTQTEIYGELLILKEKIKI